MSLEAVTKHSIGRATDEAVRLWSFASAPYPIQGGEIIQKRLEFMVIESASAFAFNARRAMEALLRDNEFGLHQPKYEWRPTDDGEVMVNLRHALDRIIHSSKMTVGFERLPTESNVISGGSYVIPYLRAETDRFKLAFIDAFALAHCFLYEVKPALQVVQKKDEDSSLNATKLPARSTSLVIRK